MNNERIKTKTEFRPKKSESIWTPSIEQLANKEFWLAYSQKKASFPKTLSDPYFPTWVAELNPPQYLSAGQEQTVKEQYYNYMRDPEQYRILYDDTLSYLLSSSSVYEWLMKESRRPVPLRILTIGSADPQNLETLGRLVMALRQSPKSLKKGEMHEIILVEQSKTGAQEHEKSLEKLYEKHKNWRDKIKIKIIHGDGQTLPWFVKPSSFDIVWADYTLNFAKNDPYKTMLLDFLMGISGSVRKNGLVVLPVMIHPDSKGSSNMNSFNSPYIYRTLGTERTRYTSSQYQEEFVKYFESVFMGHKIGDYWGEARTWSPRQIFVCSPNYDLNSLFGIQEIIYLRTNRDLCLYLGSASNKNRFRIIGERVQTMGKILRSKIKDDFSLETETIHYPSWYEIEISNNEAIITSNRLSSKLKMDVDEDIETLRLEFFQNFDKSQGIPTVMIKGSFDNITDFFKLLSVFYRRNIPVFIIADDIIIPELINNKVALSENTPSLEWLKFLQNFPSASPELNLHWTTSPFVSFDESKASIVPLPLKIHENDFRLYSKDMFEQLLR